VRQQAAAAAEARAALMDYAAPQPDLDSMSAGGLKDFLKQVGMTNRRSLALLKHRRQGWTERYCILWQPLLEDAGSQNTHLL
jgi:hypothetical protein